MKPTSCLILLAFFFASTTAIAQRTIDGNKKEAIMEEMKAKLDLSDQQMAEWEELNQSIADKRSELMHDRGMSREDRRAAMQDLQAEREEGLSQILTEEQYDQYQEMKMTIREEASNRMAMKREELEQSLIDELQLSAEQQSSWKALNEKHRASMKEIGMNEELSREEKQAKIQVLQEEKHSELSQILSPEQMEKYEQMKEEAKGQFRSRKRTRRGRGQ